MPRARRIGAIGLGVVAGLMAAELGLRALLALGGVPYNSARAERWAREVVATALLDFDSPAAAPADDRLSRRTDADLRLDPYVGFTRESSDITVARLRGAAPDATTIVVVGGSVAAGFGNAAAVLLAGGPFADRPTAHFNLAVAGHKQPQQLHVVAQLLALGVRPDVVINLDGFNEVALGVANAAAGLHPVQPSRGHWLPLASATLGGADAMAAAVEVFRLRERLARDLDAAERWGLFASAVAGSWAVERLERTRSGLLERRRALVDASQLPESAAHLRGPDGDPLPPLERSIAVWRSSSRALRALCESHGAIYVHVLQPTLHDVGSKPLTEAERAAGALPPEWERGAREGYPSLRAGGAALAEGGELFFDASGVFADHEAPLYVDGCHFGPAGDALIAEALTAFLTAAAADGRLALD